MAHQKGNHLKTSPLPQLAKVRPKSPGTSQDSSWCRVRAGPLPGGAGWARDGGGRTGAWVSRQPEEKGKQPKTEPEPQSANSCRSPNSSSSRGPGRGSWVLLPCRLPYSASGAAMRGSGGRARGAKIRPPFRRLHPPRFSLPCSGPEPPAPAVAVAVAVGARVLPAASPPPAASPAPGAAVRG